MNNTKCEVYHLKTEKNAWLAQIVLTSDGCVMITSDWGNFNITWRAYKSLPELKSFISKIGLDYFERNALSSNNYVYPTTRRIELAVSKFTINVFAPFQKILIDELNKDIYECEVCENCGNTIEIEQARYDKEGVTLCEDCFDVLNIVQTFTKMVYCQLNCESNPNNRLSYEI